MKKIALLILIFVNLGFCEFALEGKVNDIVSRVENCKVFNKQKTLSNPKFKHDKNIISRLAKPGFINSASVVSFKCTGGSAEGEFYLIQYPGSVVFTFRGIDHIQEGTVKFALVGLDEYDARDSLLTAFGIYNLFDENKIIIEHDETDEDSLDGLITTVMDSYKILKGAVK